MGKEQSSRAIDQVLGRAHEGATRGRRKYRGVCISASITISRYFRYFRLELGDAGYLPSRHVYAAIWRVTYLLTCNRATAGSTLPPSQFNWSCEELQWH